MPYPYRRKRHQKFSKRDLVGQNHRTIPPPGSPFKQANMQARTPFKLILLVVFLIGNVCAKAPTAYTSICNNKNCNEGKNCACECVDGVGMINLLGGCGGCSAKACMSTFPTQCSAGVLNHICRDNCDDEELLADGECHTMHTPQGHMQYYLSCDGKQFEGSVGLSCNRTHSRAFHGDGNDVCYYFDNLNFSFKVSCHRGLSMPVIISIVFGSVLFLVCAFAVYRRRSANGSMSLSSENPDAPYLPPPAQQPFMLGDNGSAPASGPPGPARAESTLRVAPQQQAANSYGGRQVESFDVDASGAQATPYQKL
eukprot:g1732.t1